MTEATIKNKQAPPEGSTGFRVYSYAIYAIILTLFTVVTVKPSSVNAQCTICSCVAADVAQIKPVVDREHAETAQHIYAEFTEWETYLLNEVFLKWIRPILMFMTEQLATEAMHQLVAMAPYFDAKKQLETQRLLQELTAQAHKDYHPSPALCVIPTNIRSLADAERRTEFNTFVLNQRSMDRQMGNIFKAAQHGEYSDRDARLRQFKIFYCHSRKFSEDGPGGGGDNNDSLRLLCRSGGPIEKVNRDIDFTRVVERAHTLNIDFVDTVLSEDERDLFALASNLFSSELLLRVPENIFRFPENQEAILNTRSIVAKRSVAEHSFNSVVSLRSRSEPPGGGYTASDTGEYMKVILQQLGITDPKEIRTYLGTCDDDDDTTPPSSDTCPSYFAQMEVLTKRIYQQPEFYTNLYDKPVNVERQSIALQAVALMQDFDTWQSYLRTEATLSVLLELEIMKLQDKVQNKINILTRRD